MVPTLIVMIILVLIMIACIFMLIRNEWVYKQKVKIVDRYFRQHHRAGGLEQALNSYLSYNEMMFKLWVWDVEKLKKHE